MTNNQAKSQNSKNTGQHVVISKICC